MADKVPTFSDFAFSQAQAAIAANAKNTIPKFSMDDYSRFEQANKQARIDEARGQPLDEFGQALAMIMGALPGGALMPDERDRAAIGRSLVDGATMGAASPIFAAGKTMLNDKPFSENLTDVQDAARAQKAASPLMSTATEVGASILPGNLLGKGMQKVGGKLVGSFADSRLGNLLTQGSAGALGGAGYAAGTGEGDVGTAAALGAGFSGVLGMLFPMSAAAKAASADRQAAEFLVGPDSEAAMGIGAGTNRPSLTADTLKAQRDVLGPDATIADLDPVLSNKIGGVINQNTIRNAAPLVAVARDRDVAAILGQEIDDAVGSAFGKVAGAEARDAAFAQAGQQYEAAKQAMRDEEFFIDADFLRTQIMAPFIRNNVKPTSSFAAARDNMVAELDRMTGRVPAKYNSKGKLISAGVAGKSELTVDEALALKKQFDILITSNIPDKSVHREVRGSVIEAKNAINDQLRAHPEFNKAATMYADEIDVQNAEKFAKEVFSSNTSADDLAKMYAKMSDMEKAAVARGARDVMQSKFLDKPGGDAAVIRRFSDIRPDNATVQKMATVFGEDAVTKLRLAADKAAAFAATAKNVDTGVASATRAQARGTGSTGDIGNVTDKGIILSQMAQGRGGSGALLGSVRRQFVEAQKANWQAVQKRALDLAGAQGTAADANIEQIMQFLASAGKPLPATGTGTALGMAAPITYGAYSGPNRDRQ